MSKHDIVQKLWNLCDILRDDGINYSDYVTELVLLLFIKMEFETTESGILKKHRLPEYARWTTLSSLSDTKLLKHYQNTLKKLSKSEDKIISAIYAGAQTSLKEPRHLEQMIKSLDGIDWFSAKKDGLGDLYEGLLAKNAGETKAGAGQYFTPRPLIDSIIKVIKPQAGEIIQDPAAGTAGFIIAADTYIRSQTKNLTALTTRARNFQQNKAYVGMELVSGTRRLALMNCLLHGIEGEEQGVIQLGNTLDVAGSQLAKADIILSNPPFGTAKGGGGSTRDDLIFVTGNKQLAFLEHIYRGLKNGGRAAVVLPDNVLFESGIGADIRRDLMNKCNLHTILRLPTGIFYALGVKTNVLFFSKINDKAKAGTKKVWVYDLRANAPKFGKRTPFSDDYFHEFEAAFGADPHGNSPRTDQGEAGRMRSFSRAWIAERSDNLDISWLKDENVEDVADLPEPAVLVQEAMGELAVAMAELQSILAELGEEVVL